MARIRGHRDLDVSLPLFVKRALTFGGRDFVKDEVFPWETLNAGVRRLRQLHARRLIGHERVGERSGAEVPGKVAAPRMPAPSKPKQQQPRR